MTTPVQNFKIFIKRIIKGFEVISPTLLDVNLELLEKSEKEFARSSYQAALRGVSFEDWYECVIREEEIEIQVGKAVIIPEE